ncbi:hypothetical protein DUNSADRAFT_4643 [Dunaliella salina]|uniref:Uncharacterized protein n=1 Tax=Dunaliella salina TaxID=3046 RepID=A0ABQ7GRK9_DUNSA|nr:hypothetical protein DUNSADRAFT_4643 [Dunaliella salina]|eukprot:KAF5837252.1 hypothetical protein DUNSADRAFT_4643 [Dunaliella salina]
MQGAEEDMQMLRDLLESVKPAYATFLSKLPRFSEEQASGVQPSKRASPAQRPSPPASPGPPFSSSLPSCPPSVATAPPSLPPASPCPPFSSSLPSRPPSAATAPPSPPPASSGPPFSSSLPSCPPSAAAAPPSLPPASLPSHPISSATLSKRRAPLACQGSADKQARTEGMFRMQSIVGQPKQVKEPFPPPMPVAPPDPALLAGLASTGSQHLFSSTSASSPAKQLSKASSIVRRALVGQHVCKVHTPTSPMTLYPLLTLPPTQGTSSFKM